MDMEGYKDTLLSPGEPLHMVEKIHHLFNSPECDLFNAVYFRRVKS